MDQGTVSSPEILRRFSDLWRAPMPPSFASFIGRKIIRFLLTVHGIGAFALITIGTTR